MAATFQSQQRWPQQRYPLFHHLLEVARIYQTEMMRLLEVDRGHRRLRLSFQPIMSNIPPEGIRITELAAGLGMSKQNCFQLVNQVETAGYICRQDDRQDRRARRILLTPRGLQLILDGIEISGRVDQQCRALLGDTDFRSLTADLGTLCHALQLKPLVRMDAHDGIRPLPNTPSNDLIRLAYHCNHTLMELTMARGHPSLRPSYGQVLMHIGSGGGRIRDIARINDISKQAVGQLVTELERLGYIERTRDPEDGRGKILYFTPQGKRLIRDAIAAADQLCQAYGTALGEQGLQSLEQALARLHAGLGSPTAALEHSADRTGESDRPRSTEAPLSVAHTVLYLAHRLQGSHEGAEVFRMDPSQRDAMARDEVQLPAAEAQLQALLGTDRLEQLHSTLALLAGKLTTGGAGDSPADDETGVEP